MRARDTSERAAAIQADLQDALGPEGRFRLAMQASDFAREFAKTALRRLYPSFTEDQIARELTRQLYGRAETGVK